MKIDKMRLRREAWRAGQVFWRPGKGEPLRLLHEALPMLVPSPPSSSSPWPWPGPQEP
jgi:hypothetical protein